MLTSYELRSVELLDSPHPSSVCISSVSISFIILRSMWCSKGMFCHGIFVTLLWYEEKWVVGNRGWDGNVAFFNSLYVWLTYTSLYLILSEILTLTVNFKFTSAPPSWTEQSASYEIEKCKMNSYDTNSGRSSLKWFLLADYMKITDLIFFGIVKCLIILYSHSYQQQSLSLLYPLSLHLFLSICFYFFLLLSLSMNLFICHLFWMQGAHWIRTLSSHHLIILKNRYWHVPWKLLWWRRARSL